MYDIVTIGTATRDVFLISPYFRIVNDPGHLKKMGFPTGEAQCFALGGKVEVERIALATGGGATNAAATFARQGLKVATLVKIGDDSAGREILSELKREKISTINLLKSKKPKDNEFGHGTAYSTILLAPTGERTILVYRGISENLTLKEIPFAKLQAKWAYIAPGGISLAVIQKIFRELRQRRISIAFNPSKFYLAMGLKKIAPILNQCEIVILNREEAAYLTKVDYDNEKKIFRELEAVAGIVVMTDGGNGVWISDGPKNARRIFRAKTFREKKLVNRAGAGDAFGSGFVAGLMRRPNDIEYAIRLGSANATAVIEHIGAKAGILTKNDFEKNKRWKELEVIKLNGNL